MATTGYIKMRKPPDPRLILLTGFLLVLTGVVLPFMMVLNVLEATFFLSFLSYGASITGLFLGVIGAAWYVRLNKKP